MLNMCMTIISMKSLKCSEFHTSLHNLVSENVIVYQFFFPFSLYSPPPTPLPIKSAILIEEMLQQ